MPRLLLCRGSSSDESSDPLEESGTSFFFVAINLRNFSLVLLASSPSEESEFEPDDTLVDNADADESPEDLAYNTEEMVEDKDENVQGRNF